MSETAEIIYSEALPKQVPLPKHVPGMAQSIALLVLFYAVFIAAKVCLSVFSRLSGVVLDPSAEMMIEQVIAWSTALWAGLRWGKVSFREACPLTPFPIRCVPALLVATSGFTILLIALVVLIPMPESLSKLLSEQFVRSSKLTRLVPALLFAPFAEELFFRGLVLRGFLGRYSISKAVWASAVFFGLFHLNPWQAVIGAPLGLAFAWLFLRTGSLLPCMLSHAMANCSSTVVFQAILPALGYDPAAVKALGHIPLPILAVGAAIAAGGGWTVWRQLRHYVPPERIILKRAVGSEVLAPDANRGVARTR